jgi:chromosome segregation ATPase
MSDPMRPAAVDAVRRSLGDWIAELERENARLREQLDEALTGDELEALRARVVELDDQLEHVIDALNATNRELEAALAGGAVALKTVERQERALGKYRTLEEHHRLCKRALEIGRQLAADPSPRDHVGTCRYCSATEAQQHIPLCVYRQARELVTRSATTARKGG